MSEAISSVNMAEPVKKKNYVKNGAIIGASIGAATSGIQIPWALKKAGLSLDKLDHFVKEGITNIPDRVCHPTLSTAFNKSKILRVLTTSTLLNMPILSGAGWGAAIGLTALGLSKLFANKAEK